MVSICACQDCLREQTLEDGKRISAGTPVFSTVSFYILILGMIFSFGAEIRHIHSWLTTIAFLGIVSGGQILLKCTALIC